jgi:creatinine amidohydrolase
VIASFSLLHPAELEALSPELTLFIFPVGGLEQHGPHLPLGVKLLQAEEFAKTLSSELVRKLPNWNFILMPLLPLSVDTHTSRVALPVRAHVVRDALVDQADQLKRLGFRNFVSVSSHLTPRQLTALEDAARLVTSGWFGGGSAQMVSVSSALIDSAELWNSPLLSLPKEHGGSRDTGFILHHHPESITPDSVSLPAIPSPKASPSRLIRFIRHEVDGYWGAPSTANASDSLRLMTGDAETLATRLLPWLERSEGKKQFLSAYGRFPVNGSFFKAYLLAAIFFVIMTFWVLWSMKDVFEP